jgi:hypothetical protein
MFATAPENLDRSSEFLGMLHQILNEIQNPNMFRCQQELNHLPSTLSWHFLPYSHLPLLATEEIFSAQVALLFIS